MSAKDIEGLQGLERGLRVLECVAGHVMSPCRFSELIRMTGFSAPTLARVINTLERQGYLDHLGRNVGYVLGARVGTLFHQYANRSPYLPIAKPLMGMYAEKTRDFICLSSLERFHRRYIYTLYPDTEIHSVAKHNAIERPYASLAARLLLARTERPNQEACLAGYGLPETDEWAAAGTREAFFRELDRLRGLEDVEEERDRITMMAMLVRCPGQPLAALATFTPTARFKGPRRGQLRAMFRDIGGMINQWLMRGPRSVDEADASPEDADREERPS